MELEEQLERRRTKASIGNAHPVENVTFPSAPSASGVNGSGRLVSVMHPLARDQRSTVGHARRMQDPGPGGSCMPKKAATAAVPVAIGTGSERKRRGRAKASEVIRAAAKVPPATDPDAQSGEGHVQAVTDRSAALLRAAIARWRSLAMPQRSLMGLLKQSPHSERSVVEMQRLNRPKLKLWRISCVCSTWPPRRPG